MTSAHDKTARSNPLRVLGLISLAHCLNDTTQSLVIALYPLFKDNFDLNFTEIGFLSFAYQMCASVLQPAIGFYTDKHPRPHLLPTGMTFTVVGLVCMAYAAGYVWLLAGSVLLGAGSAVFHPESSRVAYMAADGKFGRAQAIFQVGGNFGQAVGPLIAAAFVLGHGQKSLTLFACIPLACCLTLLFIARWVTRQNRSATRDKQTKKKAAPHPAWKRALAVLFVLMASKQIYTVSLANFLTFYLINRFDVSVETSQIYLFLFLGAIALGGYLGGPVGDRFGRKPVIWFSILGAAPFTLALPYMDLGGTAVLAALIGFVMASSFSAIVVFAQELTPGHVGAVAGLFFGLSFGLGGIGAALLGKLADLTSIDLVYSLCSFLPLMGLLTVFLPDQPRTEPGKA
ncbi:MAG: MFS transporter [Desulfovibrio sp.]|jgi:FSR family fosmidomycin resistance protein-like MFS transporter|nr:MFS transporter [Desulfovibrio sp.]